MSSALSLQGLSSLQRQPVDQPVDSPSQHSVQASEGMHSVGDETMALSQALETMSKQLRDALVRLYFYHVHPLCPVVDEFEFCNAYFASCTDDELFQHIDIALFQAMIFVAFTVCTDTIKSQSFSKTNEH